jgi:alkylation response protein AidB-like acyl-CoA dehydrogenase
MPVWSEQEVMIAEGASAFFRDSGSIDRVRSLRGGSGEQGFWKKAASQGWIGMLVPEGLSGTGLELRDALVVMRAAGGFIPPEPLAAAIATAQSLSYVPELAERLGPIISGDSIVLPAFVEGGSSGNSAAMRTRPLSGIGLAQELILLDDHDNVFFTTADKIRSDARPSLDGGSIGTAEITDPVRIHWGSDFRRELVDTWLMLHAAELIGLASEALARTLAYLETRKQFGVALASFQVLQQRAADAHVAIAAAEALTFEAARAFGNPRQSLAAAASFTRALAAADRISKEAIQMHGAIGFTDEYDIGLFLKRTMAIAAIGRDITARLDLAA